MSNLQSDSSGLFTGAFSVLELELRGLLEAAKPLTFSRSDRHIAQLAFAVDRVQRSLEFASEQSRECNTGTFFAVEGEAADYLLEVKQLLDQARALLPRELVVDKVDGNIIRLAPAFASDGDTQFEQMLESLDLDRMLSTGESGPVNSGESSRQVTGVQGSACAETAPYMKLVWSKEER